MPAALRFLHGTGGEQRKRAIRALKWLEEDPEIDGLNKRALPTPPARPGTYGAFFSELLLIYRLTETKVILLAIQVVLPRDD